MGGCLLDHVTGNVLVPRFNTAVLFEVPRLHEVSRAHVTATLQYFWLVSCSWPKVFLNQLDIPSKMRASSSASIASEAHRKGKSMTCAFQVRRLIQSAHTMITCAIIQWVRSVLLMAARKKRKGRRKRRNAEGMTQQCFALCKACCVAWRAELPAVLKVHIAQVYTQVSYSAAY